VVFGCEHGSAEGSGNLHDPQGLTAADWSATPSVSEELCRGAGTGSPFGVDRLHEKGWVSRTASEKDRRMHIVEELAEVPSPSERVQLVEALKKLGKKAAAE